MLDLALHHGKGPINLAEISSRQGISLSYLEQLFSRLRKNKLVTSARGPGGGYVLGRSAGEISIADVIHAVNETVDATSCGGAKNCNENERCLTHDLWEGLSLQISDFLSNISLADLVEKQAVQEVANRQAQKQDHVLVHMHIQ